MNKIFQFALLVIMSMSVTSCYYDSIYEDVVDNSTPTEDVSYQNDIIPLWVQCIGCHNGTEPPDLNDNVSYNELLNGYVVPGDADASILYKSLFGIDNVSLMPPGSMWPATKTDLVKDWINQGALNN